MKERQQRATN